MAYFAFLTDECRADALKHSMVPELQKVIEQLERDQSIASWEKFVPAPYIKKTLGKSFRLIAERHAIDNDIVVSFLALMPRGGAKYQQFFEEFAGLPKPPSDDVLRTFIKNRKDTAPRH